LRAPTAGRRPSRPWLHRALGQDRRRPALNAARIEASLADRRPAEFFIVDANGGMTVETALRTLRLLPPRLDFTLEAPCATWRECVALRRRTDVPIFRDELATDEASIAQLIADDAAEGIGLKISKSGGLTRGRRQRDMCIAAGLTVSVQETTGSDIAFAAIVHLGQTVPARFLRCVLESRDMVSVTTADRDFPVIDGRVVAPDAPILGIEPRVDVLRAPVATYGDCATRLRPPPIAAAAPAPVCPPYEHRAPVREPAA
jgi:cis-L-3-hydroxyproline dehydratase